VNRLRRFPATVRLLLAAVLALCLAVRVLTPAGFMPSFATGSLAIVPCPDAEGAAPFAPAPPLPPMPAMHHMVGMAMPPMAMAEPAHDHGKNGFHHQSCPYAAAASLNGLDLGVVLLAFLATLAAVPPLARALPAIRRHATRDRPPAQGPPQPV